MAKIEESASNLIQVSALLQYWPLVLSEWILNPRHLIALRATLDRDLGATVTSISFDVLTHHSWSDLNKEFIKTNDSEFKGEVIPTILSNGMLNLFVL